MLEIRNVDCAKIFPSLQNIVLLVFIITNFHSLEIKIMKLYKNYEFVW